MLGNDTADPAAYQHRYRAVFACPIRLVLVFPSLRAQCDRANFEHSNLTPIIAMPIETFTNFFMWCTIINAAMLIYSSLLLWLAPDFVYRIQSKWFPISRETFNIVAYSYLGLFKLLFFIFSLAPYLALLILA